MAFWVAQALAPPAKLLASRRGDLATSDTHVKPEKKPLSKIGGLAVISSRTVTGCPVAWFNTGRRTGRLQCHHHQRVESAVGVADELENRPKPVKDG